jgi:hypothetical protein
VLDKVPNVLLGDLLLLIVGNDYTGSAAQFSDNVTGWNFVLTEGGVDPDSHIGLYWRVADETEPEDVTVVAANANEWMGWYIRITGAELVTPMHKQLADKELGDTSTHDILEVTTTIDDCLCVFGIIYDSGEAFPYSVTGGVGWSQTAQFQTGDEQSGDVSGAFGQKDLASQGGSADIEHTNSASEGASWFQIAIPPGDPPDYDQRAYRFRDDDGTLTAPP